MLGMEVHPRRVPRLKLLGSRVFGENRGKVGLPTLHRRHGGSWVVQQCEHDLIREAVRTRDTRPDVEVRIANERECPLRDVALDHVRARRRDRARAQVVVRRAGRDRRPLDEAPEEVGIGPPQVEDDRPRRIVRVNSVAQVATARPLLASIGPDERREPLGGQRAPTEWSFERAQEVACLDERPVRIADAPAQLECIPRLPGRDHRERRRKVWHDLRPLAPSATGGVDEPVVGHGECVHRPDPIHERRID